MSDSSQDTLFSPRIHVTRPLKKERRGDELLRRIAVCLRHFPELDDHKVTVGVTRTAEGITVFEDFTVRFNLRRGVPSHYTIGHELTHLLQALRLVPQGEVQCDIWTLARGRLFTDELPCYLQMPLKIRRNWRRYSARVGYLCQRAISERSTRRTYILWLKQELAKLGSEQG
jgi:hypothetical protein